MEFALTFTIYSAFHIFGSGLLYVLYHADMRRSHHFQDQLPGGMHICKSHLVQ